MAWIVLVLASLVLSVLAKPAAQGFGGPSTQYGTPSGQYGSPSSLSGQFGDASSPSNEYRASPSSASNQFGSSSYQYDVPGGSQSSKYSNRLSSPGRLSQYTSESPSDYNDSQYAGQDEPMVSHEQDFQLPNGMIWGRYSVVLPDGRTQRVEYDADEDGFHPQISYDEPEGGAGGYGRGSSVRSGGHSYRK